MRPQRTTSGSETNVKTEILVIDFEPRSREATLRLLAEQNYDAVAADSATELEKLLAKPETLPAYVLLEPLLPGTDGFQICRRLKQTRVRGGVVPKVLMGARILSGPRYRALAHSAGADFFYRRPEENAKALRVLADWIGPEAAESAASESLSLAAAHVSAALPASQAVAEDRGQHAASAGREGGNAGGHEQEMATAHRRGPAGGEGDQEVFKSVTEQAVDRALTGAIHFPGGDEPLPTLMDIPLPRASSLRQSPPPASSESTEEEEPETESGPPTASASETIDAPLDIDLRLPTDAVEPAPETSGGPPEPSGGPPPADAAKGPSAPGSTAGEDSSRPDPALAAKPATETEPSAEQVLDSILERALGGPGPRFEPKDTEVSDEDLAGIDEMFTGSTAVVSKKLEGMDRGTADLLSTLEELESTVPESPLSGATGTGEVWTDTGVSLAPEVETSVPLKPPPRPKDEESLEEVLSSIPTPIAEPVETVQREAEDLASGSIAPSGSVPQPARTPAEPRVFVSAPAQRRLPLVALLAVAAIALAAALAFWALKGPAEPPLPGGMGEPVTESVTAQPLGEAVGEETGTAAGAMSEAPDSATPDSVVAANGSPEAGGPGVVLETPRPAESVAFTAGMPAARPKTPAASAEPPASTSQIASSQKVTKKTPPAPRSSATSGKSRQATATQVQPPAPAPATRTARMTMPEVDLEAPAEPVFSIDPVADSSAVGPVLSDSELTAEAAPPPKISPLVPGINGVSTPELISTTRVEPVYPPAALRMGVSGKVILQIVVKRDGTVSAAKVLAEPGGNYGFGKAAVAAVTQWRYRPAQREGRPVDAYLTVNIVFSR